VVGRPAQPSALLPLSIPDTHARFLACSGGTVTVFLARAETTGLLIDEVSRPSSRRALLPIGRGRVELGQPAPVE
jgi:hypothetical protein